MQIRTDNIKQPEKSSGIRDPESCAFASCVVFLIIVVILWLTGLCVLYSTSANSETAHFFKQLIWSAAGLVISITILLVGYQNICKWMSWPLLIGVVLLLTIPLIQRHAINGAYRWIVIGPVSIQPSEFAKVVMIVFCADFLARNTRQFDTKRWSLLGILLGIAGVVIGLVFTGRDLGTICLLGFIFVLMLFVSGLMPNWLACLIGAGGCVGFYNINNAKLHAFLMDLHILNDYRLKRLISYVDPEKYIKDEGYQLWNSFLALGSGGWFGLGFTESRIKRKYLPECHTDFILSIVGEELGFIAICAVCLLFIFLAVFGGLISITARTRQGMLIAFGMTSLICFQALINIGVICGAFPSKGMPVPFLSYGGSSLIVSMAAAAFVVSVAWDTGRPGKLEELHQRARAFWNHFWHGKGKADHGK